MTATANNNLGFVLKELNEYEEAMRHYQEALVTREQVFGPAHADTIATLYNIAELHAAMGQADAERQIKEDILHRLDGNSQ